MMVHLVWYLDPLCPHQLKKKHVKFGPPLTKLSGSAHERLSVDEVVVDRHSGKFSG